MPKLAVFPKAQLDALTVTGEMTVREWIRLASTLDIDGLEFYYRFIEFADPRKWDEARRVARDHGLEIPMLCASPDFTHPDAGFRAKQIEEEKEAIDMAAALGAKFCRVLSGQRRPEVSREQGIR